MTAPSGDQRPLLRVINADATDEEVAAILAVVIARSGAAAAEEPDQLSTWSDPAARTRGVRRAFSPGRDAWRTSYWPH